jgi:hypothetical protein
VSDNSDYKKPRTNLYELLPEVFRSDVNKSAFENVFNRYLTKPELERVDGSVGEVNPNSLINRQIPEPTPNRQAYQLQPILNAQVGTVDHMSTYVDILNELSRIGVDTDRLKKWGNAQQFNWVPPIDIDKLLHFRDYYWYDPEILNSTPQYITSRNLCQDAESRLAAYETTLNQYGEEHDIVLIDQVDNTFSIYTDLTEILDAGFVFFISDSLNPAINDRYWTTVSSEYSSMTNLTTITVQQNITDGSIVNGTISLRENLAIYEAARDCLCGGSVGWDGAQWDDNQTIGDVLWNTDLMKDYSLGGIQLSYDPASGSPSYAISAFDLWFDTTNDQLKQRDPTNTSWVVIRNAFQAIVNQTEGFHLWDLSQGCSIPTNQWVEQNKWVHKSNIPNILIAKQAQIPIIEFSPYVELNEWIAVDHSWKYRKTKFDAFEETTAQPTMFEILDLQITSDPSSGQFILDKDYGDLTDIFVEEFTFEVKNSTGNDGTYTVNYSLFQKEPDPDLRYRTVINVNETVPSAVADGNLSPISTSIGDPWRELHEHWLYVSASDAMAIDHQPENPFTNEVVTATALEVPGDSVLSRYQSDVRVYAQEYTILDVAGMNTFPLDISLHDISIVGTEDVRVYVNGLRQYGNYVEGLTIENVVGNAFVVKGDVELSPRFALGETFVVTESGGTDTTYTVGGGSPPIEASYDPINNETSITVVETIAGSPLPLGYIKTPYIIGVSFLLPISRFDTVRVEIGAMAADDIGRERINIRTIEDETDWIAQGTTEHTLIRYRKVEQIKTAQNQYPLFNIFEVDGTGTNTAERIFSYQESTDYPINIHIGRRIVEIEAGREYGFEQSLIERDNDKMFAYRDHSRLNLVSDNDVRYWIDIDHNVIKVWNGKTWDVKVLTDGHYVRPIISATEPSTPWTTIDGMLWYNTKSKQLKKRDTANTEWDDIDAYIQEVDETMQTIWKGGLNDEEYVPEYVNADRVPTAIGSSSGDWEIPNQLYYNYSHENKKQVTLSELLSHFNGIIESQEKPVGFAGSARQVFHLIDDVNYGVGGTIKEYNDSYDTFLSSIFVDNVTPPTLIEFAQDQYEKAINTLKEFFRRDAVSYLTNTSQEYLLNIGTAVADTVITQYESNDTNALIYGDGITYNETTGKGIKNWIATLPFLKLSDKRIPELFVDNVRNIVEVSHHDGHRSQPAFEASVNERIINQVITTPDTRSFSGNTIGVSSSMAPPSTMGEVLTTFGSTLPQTGLYWYQRQGGTRTLYRLSVVSVLNAQPSVTLDDGTLWYDVGTSTLRIKVGSTWPAVTTIGDDIITSAWKIINLNEILSSIIFEAETRLYEACPEIDSLVFDYDSLTPDNDEQSTYDLYLQEAFSHYVNEYQISNPFSAEGKYVISDPFTWNYKNSIISNYPSSTNLGTENGGAWQDLYEKIYGTPYPHLEPWKLQGYDDRPAWWDDEYEQTDGSRRWVYFHNNLDIDSVDEFSETILVVGNWTKLFKAGNTFDITGGGSPDPWIVTIFSVTYDVVTNKTSIRILEDVTSSIGSGSIVGPMGMWENIRKGWIPAGELLPDGETAVGGIMEASSSYSFFSVNVDDTILDSLYNPDDILPPYWDHKTQYGTLYTGIVRTLMNNLQAEVINPNFNYVYNDSGIEEWTWKVSSQYLYDRLLVAFRMQPIRLMHSAFGTEYYDVAGLQIDKRTQKVYSHSDAIFHGDIVDDTTSIKINGINQWYVNHGRFSGYDVSFSDFRRLWVNWTAPLGYQFGSFVETTGVEITNKNFDVNKKDYSINMKRSPGILDSWVDSFEATLVYAPPTRITYNTEKEWKFEFDTASVSGRSLTSYGIRNYEFTFKPGTNEGTLYRYAIVSVNAVKDILIVSGDRTPILDTDTQFTIVDSTGNDGTYTVKSSSYDVTDDTTLIGVNENLLDPSDDGAIVVSHRVLPWNMGEAVQLSTSRTLPFEFDTTTTYYVIIDSNTSFRLAETYNDAIDGIGIDIASIGTGIQYIGQVKSTFNALDGSSVWRHYEIDSSYIHTFVPPFNIQGIQESIDIIDGYVDYTENQGFKFNDNSISETDSVTGRSVSWQLEIERFIDWAEHNRSIKYQEADYYPITVDDTTDNISFTEQTPIWGTGTKVTLSTFNGTTPTPLLRNISYYIIRPTATEFKLATTEREALDGIAIDITGVGSGDLLIQEYVDKGIRPIHEINPFRNNLWFEHEQGVVANMISGPYKDVRTEQTVYDQYGRPISSDDLVILREDVISRISVHPNIPNDKVNTFISTEDEYTYLHIGGAHIFMDGYEHVVLFNNYSTEGALIYDPFIGLNTAKFDMRFERQEEFTLRPNVGGYALHDKQLIRNLEASVVDMQNYYDTFNVSEESDIALYSRNLLGYDRSSTYLDQININPKSKFVFWRGMIQNKGSVNSIKAFINSRRFIDAKVDEYWAYKIAEFGDARQKEYLSLNLFTTDSLETELKIEFIPNILDIPQENFISIYLTDTVRWYEQPNQNQKLVDNTEMYFDAEITTVDESPTITSI